MHNITYRGAGIPDFVATASDHNPLPRPCVEDEVYVGPTLIGIVAEVKVVYEWDGSVSFLAYLQTDNTDN